MAIFQQSPGIQIIEKNVSNSAPGQSTTVGAYVGAFQWGPVMSPMLIGNENDLVSVFGTPNADTYGHFFSAANFLAYTNALWVNRVATTNLNATANGSGVLIKNIDDYENTVSFSAGTFAARYPGTLGNGLIVSMADSATFATWAYKGEFAAAPSTTAHVATKGGSNDELHVVVVDTLGKFTGTANTVVEKFANVSKAADAVSYQGLANYYVNVITNRSSYVYWTAHPTGMTNWGSSSTSAFLSLDKTATSLTVTSATSTASTATLGFTVQLAAPFQVGQSIVVAGITPAAYNGTYVVTASTTTSVTYALLTAPAAGTVFGTVADSVTNTGDYTYTLTGGTDDNTPTDSELQLGWDMFVDPQNYDISLLITGNASAELAAYVTTNIADVRRDCIAFSSIRATTGPIWSTSTTKITDAKAFKTFDSTYAVIDTGYKYMYDKYNDKYRWIALNADVAGLCARVDAEQDTWMSPAGMTKGQIKGAIKLSWNPSKAERDSLYPAAINPVISQTGQGTILFGDRTATLKPSAFDRINVRRLFLILEKTISNSAKYQLFEINDAVTRSQFVATVEPFLRDVQGRRGIDAYKVICDESNNTPQVISTNEFRGTILVRPKYSINYVTLTFTAVGPSVDFAVAAGA